ncbi:MAG: PQQ-dependent sugar dehydrogenase [Cytophagaceae bacterium]
MKILHSLLGMLLLCYCSYPSYTADLKPGFVEQVVAEGLDPTSMAIAPDGRIFIAEKNGRIRIVQNGSLLSVPFLTIHVDNHNERGINGIVLDPDFDFNGYVYIYYTVKDMNFNRVSRFTSAGNTALPGSELVLLNLNLLPSGIHNGGAMLFGNDGKLYIATGDGGNGSYSQDLGNLLGKILRINSDGSVPPDNPFYESLEGDLRSIWAYGLRNPYTMAYDKVSGMLLVNDVGQFDWEEVNNILPGKNYGWPLIEGMIGEQTPPDNYQDPVYVYGHDKGCAIVGAAFYRPELPIFPPSYSGKFFFADYCMGILSVFDPMSGLPIDTLATGMNQPTYLVVSPEGDLYYLQRAGIGDGSVEDNTSTSNGTLWKIHYSGNSAPFIARDPINKIVSVGESARFTVVPSGAKPFTFQWYVNEEPVENSDSAILILENVSLDLNGAEIKCIVTNIHGIAETEIAYLHVSNNTRPVPVIHTPVLGSKYRGGSIISFTGTASDAEDGSMPASSLQWEILFHHDDHTHPAMAAITGITEGTFEIPKIGETSTNVWYRIYLTATDSEGLSQTIFTDIHPELVTITFNSVPENLTLSLDGIPVQTPYQFESVAGMTRAYQVPIIDLQKDLVFLEWDDNRTDGIIYIDAEESRSSITAYFEDLDRGNGDGLLGTYYNANHWQYHFNYSPSLIRVDPQINFNWGEGSPAPEITENSFVVQWTGFIQPYVTDDYQFTITSDDGNNLWINDVKVIDDWTYHGAIPLSGSIHLERGQQYPIRVEYFEAFGGAAVKLEWKGTNFQREVVPKSQLYSGIITKSPEKNERSEVFPNPFENEIEIKIKGHSSDTKLNLTDINGRPIISENNYTGDIIWSLDNLPLGVYFLILTSTQKSETIKIVKVK